MAHSFKYLWVLESPRWRALKWRRLLVAGFACECGCGYVFQGKRSRSAMRDFDLHHAKGYQMLGNEDLEDVRIVRRECHERIHG